MTDPAGEPDDRARRSASPVRWVTSWPARRRTVGPIRILRPVGHPVTGDTRSWRRFSARADRSPWGRVRSPGVSRPPLATARRLALAPPGARPAPPARGGFHRADPWSGWVSSPHRPVIERPGRVPRQVRAAGVFATVSAVLGAVSASLGVRLVPAERSLGTATFVDGTRFGHPAAVHSVGGGMTRTRTRACARSSATRPRAAPRCGGR
jgi:hypothetical protein